MRTLVSLVAVACITLSAGAADRKAKAGRDQAPSVTIRLASDTPVDGYQAMTDGNGDAIYVSPVIEFADGDFVSADVVRRRGQVSVDIALSADAGERLSAVTGNNLGGRMAILSDDALISAPRINDRVTSGRVMVTGTDEAMAERLADAIRRAAERPSGPTIILAPSSMNIAPGDEVSVDVLVSNMGDLRGYQIALDVVGGENGGLEMMDLNVDISRANYVFTGLDPFNASDRVNRRLAAALMGSGVDVSQERYAGTYVFRASEDARGTFRLVAPSGEQGTVLLNTHGTPIKTKTISRGTITVR